VAGNKTIDLGYGLWTIDYGLSTIVYRLSSIVWSMVGFSVEL